ncbi:MAG TPA: HigA family addiction module antitoxin [Bradyrhizobium sp.]|jgi:addiction module HigA family antidote
MTYPAIDNLPAVHPGEILRDELEALGLSARKFAAHIEVRPNTVTAILNGEGGVSAEMALRLARAFGTSEQYWLNLQNLYATKRARATTNVESISRLVVEAAD